MKRNLHLLLLLAGLLSGGSVCAQVPVAKPHDGATLIAPRYFGPYAFPVPDQTGGRLDARLQAELAMDAVIGTLAGPANRDYTYAPAFSLRVPLWTDRAVLGLWGEFHEWYEDTPETRALRRVAAEEPLAFHDGGSLYFSLELLLIRERKYLPSLVVRAVTQTATGDDFERARHYDCPAYFFDASLGKSWDWGAAGKLRIAGMLGFLCWQRDMGAQNDAFLLGAQLCYDHPHVRLTAEYGQYSGWGHISPADADLEPGDAPKALKFRLDVPVGNFSPFCYFQYGLQDWPFYQFRAGLAWSFDILHGRKGQKMDTAL
ncbi:MAG: hypothetical protein J5871_05950 [Bacteroidales bacterium]|nr:hypothetical protein [Bacteroidales bacterium]